MDIGGFIVLKISSASLAEIYEEFFGFGGHRCRTDRAQPGSESMRGPGSILTLEEVARAWKPGPGGRTPGRSGSAAAATVWSPRPARREPAPGAAAGARSASPEG